MHFVIAAAFGRLCVETVITACESLVEMAAAFGRLCVETNYSLCLCSYRDAAAFGRLCVETPASIDPACKLMQPPSGGCVLKLLIIKFGIKSIPSSRLRAAVC